MYKISIKENCTYNKVFMNDFLNNINLIRKNWVPSKRWESELWRNEEKDKILIKKFPPTQQERNYAKNYAHTVVKVIDKLDQQSISKSTDAMIAINTIFSLPSLMAPVLGGISGYLTSRASKTLKNQKKLSAFNGAMIGAGIYSIISQFISSQLEKEATRLARFQSRRNASSSLSDFVVDKQLSKESQDKIFYQIEKDNDSPKLNFSQSLKKAFKTLKEMQNDYKEFKKWKKDFKNKEVKANEIISSTKFTDEEIIQAQKDRNKITNIIYKLELAANNEEINFQYAIDLLQFGAKMSGAVLATLLCCLIPKSSNLTSSKLIKNSKILIPFTIPIFSIYLVTLLAKYQKDSAKLGRYEKKKELINNEENFITFDDSKRNEIALQKDSVIDENIIKRVFKDIKSIKTMPKRLGAMYSDYKFSETNKASNDTKITEKQKKDAELLQKQLYYSYEKIDEKSEGFSDDMDVILKSAKIGIGTAINVGFNIYSLNLLTKKLKGFNNNKMPGFFEGIKLMKHLKRNDMISVFIIPYIIKSCVCVLLDTISSIYRKKANKVGVMTAINELQDEKIFTSDYLNGVL